MNREELLRQLTMQDFMALDMHLYLNTHPQNNEALSLYNMYAHKADQLRRQFESTYGPLTAFRTPAAPGWEWSNTPWPWQTDFDVTLERSERHVGV